MLPEKSFWPSRSFEDGECFLCEVAQRLSKDLGSALPEAGSQQSRATAAHTSHGASWTPRQHQCPRRLTNRLELVVMDRFLEIDESQKTETEKAWHSQMVLHLQIALANEIERWWQSIHYQKLNKSQKQPLAPVTEDGIWLHQAENFSEGRLNLSGVRRSECEQQLHRHRVRGRCQM